MTDDTVSTEIDEAGDALAASTSEASLARTEQRSRQIEADIAADPSRFRVMTGDRPTGSLHVGHYFGSLMNRVRLQNAGVDTFVLIADYQVITDRDGTGPIAERVQGLVTDYLAVGIDPGKVDHLHPLRGTGAEPAHASVPVSGQRFRAVSQPDGEGGARGHRGAPHVGSAPHLPRAPGRRHPVLQGQPRARWARTSSRTSNRPA
jgi:hypothetical protein